jgi:predicted ferric reductase
MSAQLSALQRRWLAAYVAALVLPMLLMALQPALERPVGVFALAMGFAAYMGMGLQVLLVSRVRMQRTPVSHGALIAVHRVAGMAILVLVLAHVGIIYATSPWYRAWLWPVDGPLEARAGFVALVSMLLITVTSIWRRRIKLSYEHWRIMHSSLTVVMIASSYIHVLMASNYAFTPSLRLLALVVAAGSIGLVAHLRFGRAFNAARTPYVVHSVHAERGGATTLQLRPAGRARVQPVTRPAQFAWVRVGDAAYDAREHPFTIASAVGDPTLQMTIRAIGDGTRRIAAVQPGTRVLVDGPHGGVRADPLASGWLLVAGGIGVTPAMSIIRSHIAGGDQRPIDLVYAVRSWQDAPLRDELEHYAASGLITLHPVCSDAPPPEGGHAGFVTAELLARIAPSDIRSRGALTCGPGSFARNTADALMQLGMERERVHVEGFASA